MKKERIYSGNFPDWKYEGSENFDDLYSLVFDKYYHTGHNQTATPVNLNFNKGNKRQCSICSKTNPDVTFNKEAHAIPACLGNRIFFTSEECDACNEFAGSTWESHLGTMTTAERSIFGIPNRSGSVKWTVKDGDNQIKRSLERGLVIEVGGEDDAVDVEVDEINKKVTLKGPASPYEEVSAIKSLLHSAWFFLDKETRKKHNYLLDILFDRIKITPFRYIKGFFPDHNSQLVRFRFYEINDENIDAPKSVIQLNIGHSFLMWSAPNLKKSLYQPLPMPKIKAREDAPPPSMTLNTSPDLIGKKTLNSATFELVFDSMADVTNEKNSTSTISNNKYQKFNKSHKISIQLTNRDYSKKIDDFFIKLKNVGSTNPRYDLTSAKSPLLIYIYPTSLEEGAKLNLSCNLKPEGFDLDAVKEAITFIEKMTSTGMTMTINSENGKPIFKFNDPTNASIDFSFEKDLIDKLQGLNKELGLSLKFPKKIDSTSLKTLDDLNLMIVKKEHQDFESYLTANQWEKPITVDQAKESIAKNTQYMQYDPQEVELFGQKIKIPALHADPILLTIHEISSPPDSDFVDKLVLKIKGAKFKIVT